jgi:hypothetical protein
LFESIRPPAIAEELRSNAAVPLIAFVVLQFYETIVPLIGRRVPALYYAMQAIACFGAVWGFFASIEIAIKRRDELRGLAIAWLVAALAMSAVCGWAFLAF